MMSMTQASIFLFFIHVLTFANAYMLKESTSSIRKLSLSSVRSLMTDIRSQVLIFNDSETNIPVVLIGAMHYNPQSITLVSSTINKLGSSLQSVVIESCHQRWNKTLIAQSKNSYLRKLFDNEMQCAADITEKLNISLVLGDQDISITSRRMKELFLSTLVDLLLPWNNTDIFFGWRRYVNDVKTAYEKTLIVEEKSVKFKSSLNVGDFFHPTLLAGLPVSLFRYPLALFTKSPKIALLMIVLIVYSSMDSYVYDTPSSLESLSVLTLVESIPQSFADHYQEWVDSFLIMILEVLLLGKVFLQGLLAERNEILAKNIREECKKAVLMTCSDDKGMEKERVIVAVLGMAHCNGIKKLLCANE